MYSLLKSNGRMQTFDFLTYFAYTLYIKKRVPGLGARFFYLSVFDLLKIDFDKNFTNFKLQVLKDSK